MIYNLYNIECPYCKKTQNNENIKKLNNIFEDIYNRKNDAKIDCSSCYMFFKIKCESLIYFSTYGIRQLKKYSKIKDYPGQELMWN